MNPIPLLSNALAGNVEMVKMHLADFSDADMLVRPTPGANHAAWQMGHMVGSEAHLVGMVNPQLSYDLPANWRQRFSKETARSDDRAAFPTKAELLDRFAQGRQKTLAWVKTLSAEDLDRPGPEPMRAMAPTLGAMLMLINGHVLMHVGQLQVIRRKLGKPMLF